MQGGCNFTHAHVPYIYPIVLYNRNHHFMLSGMKFLFSIIN